jgi:hypothetical protein
MIETPAQSGWVIAERREGGRLVPLFTVDDEHEANTLAAVLRQRGRDLVVAPVRTRRDLAVRS